VEKLASIDPRPLASSKSVKAVPSKIDRISDALRFLPLDPLDLVVQVDRAVVLAWDLVVQVDRAVVLAWDLVVQVDWAVVLVAEVG
jgi:hypothetical protein